MAFYSNKHTVFRVAKQDAQGGHGSTQFGRALSELNIAILCPNSSQAKGRVERVNWTLQDRLVKELRLAGINSIAAGKAFLPDCIARFNFRFAVILARATDLHRKLNVSAKPAARHSLPPGAALCRRTADSILRPKADHADPERGDRGHHWPIA